EECLDKLRELIALLPKRSHDVPAADTPAAADAEKLYDLIDAQGRKEYDMHRVIDVLVDRDSWQPFKPDYGQTLICGFCRIGGQPAGIVANQRMRVQSKTEGIQIGGVIYPDSADKAARFVMDCNQMRVPIVFLQDVMGFMVGKEAEHGGIIRSGAKLVNAVSNCIVPKITVVVGGSFGAGNYAMCGKAYDPTFIFAWPNAKYAVMGAAQASGVIFDITKRALQRDGKEFDEAELHELREQIHANYEEKTDIRYGAARGWIDAIIAPEDTRAVVMRALQLAGRERPTGRFHTGVLQV
ncbi:MAG: carboxyl transferase domain-containing protein, partial [Candidatus Hydrogenedentales bacterium]